MEFICHRRNTIEELKSTDINCGVEIDIRSFKDELIIHHEPFIFKDVTFFKDWIKFYNHGTLILNVKEEGLEDEILNILKTYQIDTFFFLDQSFPFLVKTFKSGEKRIAVRFSEFESIQTVINLKGKVDWVWVDCFESFHLTSSLFFKLKKNNFKLCLVSPELQGMNPEKTINEWTKLITKRKIKFDAVCTKRVDLWIKNLK